MKELNYFHFNEIDQMPEIPQLPIPDYVALNRQFRVALLKPENGAFSINKDTGHPNFAAYLMCDSNEMVTWGILAIGEWLCANDTTWISPTYTDFFSEELGLYLNTSEVKRIEYWYLFYANTLAGAMIRTLYNDDKEAIERMEIAAESLLALAKEINYDFNDQGYDYTKCERFTMLDDYRQPDSIAGFAYNMLFAARLVNKPEYLEESYKAAQRYLSFSSNPWYEIPNGSAGMLAVAWLNSHGYKLDVQKAAGWIFDHDEGPLQIGKWGAEEINGLMIGWRGHSRQYALDTAYSMETLMPLQFLLPSVKYCPQLADAVAKYVLNVLSTFQLFYAKGVNKIYETKPELDPYVPYEKLEAQRDGHIPAACGDFWGHRSVYGAGYLYWVEAMAVSTSDIYIFAYDLSLTDWLSDKTYPVYLLRNPSVEEKNISFTPTAIWRKKLPFLFEDKFSIWELNPTKHIEQSNDSVNITLLPGENKIVALLPIEVLPYEENGMIKADGVELCAVCE